MSATSTPTAPAEPRPDAPRRVPPSAFVSVRPPRPALVVRLRPGMPRHHALMLALAAALMLMGAVRAHRNPMDRAIVVPTPLAAGVEIA